MSEAGVVCGVLLLPSTLLLSHGTSYSSASPHPGAPSLGASPSLRWWGPPAWLGWILLYRRCQFSVSGEGAAVVPLPKIARTRYFFFPCLVLLWTCPVYLALVFVHSLSLANMSRLHGEDAVVPGHKLHSLSSISVLWRERVLCLRSCIQSPSHPLVHFLCLLLL